MFSSEEQHPPEYHELKKRQGFVWVFLSLVILMIGGLLAFVMYGIMGGGNAVTTTSTPITVTPAPAKNGTTSVTTKKSVGTYFLTGELFASEKKFRIYKVYYPTFSKEEFFSIPWRNTAITPAVAQYGEYIGVFSDPGTGIFIDKNGRVASVNDGSFFPPYAHFSVSPDGKKMVYFRYLSSVGTTSLTVRDLEKNEDLYGWPVGSSASETCEFRGWSTDGSKAYCVSVRRGTATLKTIDINRYVIATVASVSGARSAEYYPDRTMLVVAGRDGISLSDISTGTKRIMSSSTEAKEAINAMLAGDGKAIVFTANNIVHVFNMETGEQRPVHEGVLVSISPDSRHILFREEIDEVMVGDHFSMMLLDGGDHQNLHTVMNTVTLSQFLGWFSE